METTQSPTGRLAGKRIAILATNGVEQVELTAPRQAFDSAGARTVLIAPRGGTIQGFNHQEKADLLKVDMPLDEARADEFDGLMLPGGALNADELRMNPQAVALVKSFATSGKVLAVICHAPWLLVEAGLARDLRMTSWPGIQTDLKNAGAVWVDAESIVDRGIVTSRKPEDIAAFIEETIAELSDARRPARSST